MKTARLILAALAVAAVAGCASLHAPLRSSAHVVASSGPGIDHVPIWTRDQASTAELLTGKLGFRLNGPTRFPDGVETRSVALADATYLELFSVYDQELARAQAPTEMEFLRLSFGPTNFGLRSTDISATASELQRLGFPAQVEARGEGDLWRTATIERNRVPGEPFFIQYDTPRTGPAAAHPNTATRITAVWLASEDAASAGSVYRGMGLRVGGLEPMPRLGGQGVRVKVGDSWILIVEPTGPGLAQTALDRQGHKVFGLSLEVADLDAASAVLERGFGAAPETYQGPFGRSVRAETAESLGLTLEFHARR